jgi:uncharacterized pyridoxamine 5'-phosphate oxidase family protein
MEIKDIKDKLENSTIAVSTVNENKPHIIFILYPKIVDNKVIITDNYMNTTIKNLKKNNNICIAFYESEKGWRISGKAEYHNSGKWLNFVKKSKKIKGFQQKVLLLLILRK